MAPANGLLDTIRKRFSEATRNYDSHARVQDEASIRLAGHIERHARRNGLRTAYEGGAGTGLLTRRLTEANLFQHLTVTDISGTMLKVNERLLSSTEGVRFERQDLNAFEPGGPYGIWAANMCLQWVQDPERVLQAAAASLEPGGMLAFSVPVDGSFAEWKSAAEKTGTPFSANPLYGAEDWARFTADCDLVVKSEVFETQMQFPGITAFFHSLKFIGASTALAHEPIKPGAMRRLVAGAPEPFFITYRIAVVTGVAP